MQCHICMQVSQQVNRLKTLCFVSLQMEKKDKGKKESEIVDDERANNLNSEQIKTVLVQIPTYVYHPASGSNPGFMDLKFPKDVLVSHTHVLLCTLNPFHQLLSWFLCI